MNNLHVKLRQAALYAAQMRTRKQMGNKYKHAVPWRGPAGIKNKPSTQHAPV